MTSPWPYGIPLAWAYPMAAGRARFRHRDDQVRLDRVLGGQHPADLDPGGLHAAPRDGRVRAGQVHVLEQAARRVRPGETPGPDAALVDGDQLARLDLPYERRTHDVQGRGLAGHHPAAGQLAQHQGTETLRVAGRVQGVLVHEHQRVGPADQRQRGQGTVLDAGHPRIGEQRGEHVGVGGGPPAGKEGVLAVRAAGDVRELQGVDQVAVVAEGQAGDRGGAERGLGVLPGRGASGRVAAVPDRDVAAQRGQRGLVEDLGHQAHVLVHHDPVTVADGDARRLLAPVLQGVQAEVGELGDFLTGGPHAEHSACVPRRPVSGIYVVRQSAIGVDHAVSLMTAKRWSYRAVAATGRRGPRAARSR